jgi:hypothetical protein
VGRSGESGAVSIPTVEQCAEELPWSNEFTHPENGEENEMETNLPGKVYERRARSDQRSWARFRLRYVWASGAGRPGILEKVGWCKTLKLAGLSPRKKILLAVVDPLDRKLNACLHSVLNGAEL